MLKSIFQDGHNESISSKRVITFLAFVLCAFGFIADIFGYKVTPALFDSMMYIVVAGLGFTASEKFAPKAPPPAQPLLK
jgi:hypothetical protein